MPKGNMIIAGDRIHAGIDPEDVERTGPLSFAIVIQFPSARDLQAALATKSCFFDVFGSPAPSPMLPAPAG